MKIPLWLMRLIVAVVVVSGVAWVADSVVAMRVESRIANRVQDIANLQAEPKVNASGRPYLAALATGKVPFYSVQALDVAVDGLGLVNARTQVSGIKVDPSQVFSGEIEGETAELWARSISLDGVSMGRILGMNDLNIANPYDISPGGGVSAEAELTGTPEGFDEPITVVSTLRLVGDQFEMRMIDVIDPGSLDADDPADRQRIEDLFNYTLDVRKLPLNAPATAVSLAGGSIYFEAQRRNVPVRLEDLSPIEVADGDVTPDAETTSGKGDLATR